MATATMTLTGLYNFDSTLFDNMIMPDGVDTETIINTILQTSGEFEVLYPDVTFLKNLIGVIAKKWNRTFTKWYEALQLKYDPIYNYDRYEEWEDNGSGDNSGSSETSGQNDNLVTAFNQNALAENERNTSSQKAGSESTYNDKSTHSGHLYGNIGVTTSQQMLESELKLARFNLYQQIADIFVRELCIPVYS